MAVGATGICAGCIGQESRESDEQFPSEEITVTNIGSPGATTDILFRGFSSFFEEELGTNVPMEFGGGYPTAADEVWNEEPDGYTLGVTDISSLAITTEFFDLQFSVDEADFIGSVCSQYFGWVSKMESWEDVIAQTHENTVSLGISHPATMSPLGILTTIDELGGDISNTGFVPLGGTPDIVTGVVRGDVDVGWIGINSSSQQLIEEQEDVNVVFVNRPDEDPFYPNAPTVGSLGEDMPFITFTLGLFGPPGISDERVNILSNALQHAVDNPDYIDWANDQGAVPTGSPPSELEEELIAYLELTEKYRDDLVVG